MPVYVIWFITAAIFGLWLISGLLLLISPTKYRKFQAWQSRDKQLSEYYRNTPISSPLRYRVGGAAMLAGLALMIWNLLRPSWALNSLLVLLFPIGLLVVGVTMWFKPEPFFPWIHVINRGRPMEDWELKRATRAQAVIAIAGVVIIVGFRVWSYFHLPTIRPFGRKDFLLLPISLFWIGCGIFVVARPERALAQSQYPWTKLPKWGMQLLGFVLLLVGMIILVAYVLHYTS